MCDSRSTGARAPVQACRCTSMRADRPGGGEQGLRLGVRADDTGRSGSAALRPARHAQTVPDDKHLDCGPGALAPPLWRRRHVLHHHTGRKPRLRERGACTVGRLRSCPKVVRSHASQSFYVDTMEEDGRRVERLFRDAASLGIAIQARMPWRPRWRAGLTLALVAAATLREP